MAQGPLENMEAFARDFNCADGSAMNPSEKCQVSLVLLLQTIVTCQQGWARPYTHLPTTMNLPNLWWRPTTSRTADFSRFKGG